MRMRIVHGFTLVELLVVIAIIGVMVAIALPAVHASREAGRRSLCQSNLSQLAMALQSYENAYESFPAGVVNPDEPIRSELMGLHQGWIIQMLPYLDDRNAYRAVDLAQSVYSPANAEVRSHWPAVLRCPSEPEDANGTSSYAGCHHDVEGPIAADNRGVLFLNSFVRRENVTDGVAQTMFVGEKRTHPEELSWMSGTRATLRNTGLAPNDVAAAPADPAAALLAVGSFGSAHAGGTYMALGDGAVRFITDQIDLKVWQQLGNRADGKLLTLDISE